MASLRDIRNRISSVKNTQQLTRAMKMVAAAKLRRAQERIFSTRPYAYKIGQTIGHLKAHVDPGAHPLFEQRPEIQTVLMVIVTADRGLAGAFNANIIKLAEQTIEQNYAEYKQSGNLLLMCIGRKGHDHFRNRDYKLVGDYRGTFDSLEFKTANNVADRLEDGYRKGEWDEVVLLYNEFKNTISQNRIAEPYLPVPAHQFVTPVMELEGSTVPDEHDGSLDYIFEPSPGAILDMIVPQYLSFQVWRALLESNASEQGARMVAMDNATSNARELLKDLTLSYNRARQAAITKELIEITSGADALEA
ncbi:MAG: ATP synthase F1 subunit gamma [Rhodothermales bacterium]|nr:ATP synthase F1 subunit gamma [Rhodothermales bacterium]